jgi:hypothetical protein
LGRRTEANESAASDWRWGDALYTNDILGGLGGFGCKHPCNFCEMLNDMFHLKPGAAGPVIETTCKPCSCCVQVVVLLEHMSVSIAADLLYQFLRRDVLCGSTGLVGPVYLCCYRAPRDVLSRIHRPGGISTSVLPQSRPLPAVALPRPRVHCSSSL